MNIEACRQLFLRENSRRVLCGFSGGADSTAALLVTFSLARECGFDVEAVHFDHGLRAESASEAVWCEEFCRERGIKFRKIKLEIYSASGGIENAARTARLAEWKKLSQQADSTAVVTGHHADDKRENLFLRLMRGSNVSGATGLREMSEVGGVKFLRPLLGFTRREIEEYLHENNIFHWVTDASNFDSAMLRNYLRNEVIPEICARVDFASAGLNKSISCLECDADFIEREADKSYAEADCSSRLYWANLHNALKVRVLRRFLSDKCSCDEPVSSTVFERFCEEISRYSDEPRRIPLGNFTELVIQRDSVEVWEDAPEKCVWNWQDAENCTYGRFVFDWRYTDVPDCSGVEYASFDADVLGNTVIISAPENGEKFIPFGTARQVSIKKLRVDRKVPSYPAIPVFRNSSGTAVWLPFIRNGNFAVVTPETRRIVTFYVKSSSKSRSS